MANNLKDILARYSAMAAKENCVNPLAVMVLSMVAIVYSSSFLSYLKEKDCNSDLWKYVYSANVVNVTVASVSLISALLAHFTQNEKCVNLSWWVLVAMMLYMCMTALGSWIYLGKQDASKMKSWLITASLILLLSPVAAAAADWKMKGKLVGLFASA